MDTHTARPTGRRQITLSQLQAEAAGAAPFTPTTPGRALAAFKRAEPALGVPAQVVKLVDYLVGRTRPQDWDGGPGLGPIAWPSDAELEDRLNVGPSQRKATIRAAQDAGYVRLRRSPKGKQFVHGDKQGSITDAYGFDLAPLAERMAEFERLSAEWEARRAEGRRLRREITTTRNHVLSLVDLALAEELAGEDWPAAAAKADALWHQRGTQRDPLALVPIAARLRALDILVGEQLAAALAAVEHGEHGETDPMGTEYRPHLTTTTQVFIAKANTTEPAEPAAVGPERPVAHEERSSREQSGRHVAEKPARAEPARKAAAGTGTAVGVAPPQNGTMPSCALRGFVVTPGFILEIAPIFRDWTSSARPSWDELSRVAYDIRGALGISPHAWGQAWITLGGDAAITVLAVICARHAAGQVKSSPGGLLRRMVERHEAGTLRLDRSLFGLADKLRKERRETNCQPNSAMNFPAAQHRANSASLL